MHSPLNRVAMVHPRILVVDDDESCRTLSASILSMSGYVVETAVDGADALLRIVAEEFDLVLTDWQMLGVDGVRLIVALRLARIDLPVIVVSGAFPGKTLPDPVRQEVFATLSKPFSPSRLVAVVAMALRHSRPPASVAVRVRLPCP